jgi:hypothetical protein
MIQNEIRIPLIGVFFIGIGVPFFYIEELGIFAAVLFALTSLTFFYVFALMPQKLEERHANLKVRFSPLWLYHRLFQKQKEKIDLEYQEERNSLIALGVTFLVIGIGACIIYHLLS